MKSLNNDPKRNFLNWYISSHLDIKCYVLAGYVQYGVHKVDSNG